MSCLQVRQLIESLFLFPYYFQGRLACVNAAFLVLGEVSGIIALLFEM